MTTKVEVLSLVDYLSASLADSNECSRIFDETMIELAHDPRAWCSQAAFSASGTVQSATDPDQLELRTGIVKLLAVFHSGRELSQERIHSLAGSDVHWRDQVGEPWAYTREGENGRTIRYFPKPRRPSISVQTESTYTDSAYILYCDARTTSIPDILCLPLTLLVLAREFERESNHRDLSAAEIWRAMAQSIMNRIY